MTKRIGMVLDRPYPPDIRVEKEARALVQAGYEVSLLAFRRNSEELERETVDGIDVWRIMHLPTPRRQLSRGYFQWRFIDLEWPSSLDTFIKEADIGVLHVHDLPLVKTGLRVAKILEIPVVADLHENLPAAVRVTNIEHPWTNPRRWLAADINVRRWEAYEEWAVKQVEKVIVVVEEAKERLVSHYGIPDDKVTIISNTEDINVFQQIPIDARILEQYQGRFMALYVGGFARHRGLETTVRALSLLGDDFKLLLVGDQGNYGHRLKQLALDCGVTRALEILAWQPFTSVASYIEASEVGLVPHERNAHTDSTVPHKLFQYMVMGKPVVVSDCQPLARIVDETGCGLVFRSGDPRDLANKLQQLYDNQALRNECGENGRKAVNQIYNWCRDGRKLISLYNTILQLE